MPVDGRTGFVGIDSVGVWEISRVSRTARKECQWANIFVSVYAVLNLADQFSERQGCGVGVEIGV